MGGGGSKNKKQGGKDETGKSKSHHLSSKYITLYIFV